MKRVGDGLAALPVLDEHGTAHPLGELWRARPAVLALVRHFGCVFCREQVTELCHERSRIEDAGADVHVIGNGAPSFLLGFRDATGWTGPLYTDPTLEVYRATGMKRGLRTVLRPSVARHAVRAFRRGHRQGRTQGDSLQQGGVLVIDRDGIARFRHASQVAGDHPRVDDVLAALAP